MRKRSAIVIAASVGALALLGTTSPGLATQTVKFDSKVTMPPNAPAFHGRVKSSKHACEVHRKVKLFKQRPGPDKLLGKDRSNRRGKWKVIVDPLNPGSYYAKVVRREEGAAGTIFVCRGDRGPVATIG